MTIIPRTPPQLDLCSGAFHADHVQRKSTRMGDLSGIFLDEQAYRQYPADAEVYQVEMLASPQQEGELHTGVTHLFPGRVGDEYFMTRGHFHQRREQAEFYFGLRGSGLLLLQPEQGEAWCERVFAGSVHHIPGYTAHRLVNTGDDTLSALAVWPVTAGHDYQALRQEGFGLRVFSVNGAAHVEVAGER